MPRHYFEALSNEELTPLFQDKRKRVDTAEIDIVASNDGALVYLKGRIDIDSSPAVRDRLLPCLHASHAKTLGIDLSGVTHIDSSGVATLIEALRIANSHNTELKLQGLKGRLLRLFQSTGILSLFNGSTRPDTQPGSKVV